MQKNKPIHILITTPSGGTRMTSRFIAETWVGEGAEVKLRSTLPGDFPIMDDRVDVKSMMDDRYDNAEGAGRFLKIWRCFVILFLFLLREKPSKILVIGMPLSVPICLFDLLFFWRKCDISLLVDTHATANRNYKKTRRNSLAFRVMSKVTHSPIFYKFVMKRARSVIALISDMGDDMINNYALKPEKLIIIPPIIDASYFDMDLLLERPKDNILFIGRLSAQKNVNDLIDAFAVTAKKNKKAKLVLLGDGEEEEELKKKVKNLTLEKPVEFCGRQDNVQAYLERATCTVLSSHYEGFPLVILESCAAGVPVVAYDCPSGPKTILEEGISGHVVPQYDIEALGDAMTKVLEVKWSPNAIRESVMEFHPDVVREKYGAFLKR